MTLETRTLGVTRVARNPGILGGEPTVGGSRTTVMSIVLVAREGEGVDGILRDFPHLTPEDVADALAFYLQNQEEIERIIEEECGE